MAEQFALGFQTAMLAISAMAGALSAVGLVIAAGTVLFIGASFIKSQRSRT